MVWWPWAWPNPWRTYFLRFSTSQTSPACRMEDHVPRARRSYDHHRTYHSSNLTGHANEGELPIRSGKGYPYQARISEPNRHPRHQVQGGPHLGDVSRPANLAADFDNHLGTSSQYMPPIRAWLTSIDLGIEWRHYNLLLNHHSKSRLQTTHRRSPQHALRHRFHRQRPNRRFRHPHHLQPMGMDHRMLHPRDPRRRPPILCTAQQQTRPPSRRLPRQRHHRSPRHHLSMDRSERGGTYQACR